MKRVFLGIVGAAVWGCSAAGWAAQLAEAPPEVQYGRDRCVECAKVLRDVKLGAAVSDGKGVLRLFDDTGCMARYLRHNPLRPAKVWVKDFYSRRWVDGYRARFFEHLDLRSEKGREYAASVTDGRRPDDVRSYSFDEWVARAERWG